MQSRDYENESASLVTKRPQARPLPPRPHAIDSTIHIATSVVTDRSARHRARPEYDARPGNTTSWILSVLTVDHCTGGRWIERETGKAQEGASSNPANSR